MHRFRRFKIREFSIAWWMMGAIWFGLIYALVVLWLSHVG